MTAVSLPHSLRTAIVSLCLVLAIVVGTIISAQAAPATGLRFDPDSVPVASGETVTLSLWVDNVEDLYRLELHLDYDEAGLEVQDADPGRASVQIEPGPIFCQTCAPWNEATDGKIHFVAQRDPFDGPFSGSGIAATITLLVTATEPNTYTVTFDQAKTRLLTEEDQPIDVDQFTAGALVLPPPLVMLTGQLTRDGWGGDERSVINGVLYLVNSPDEPYSWGRACSNEEGDFTLEIEDVPQPTPADILPASPAPTSPSCTSRWAFVRLDFTNYLSECYWECADGNTQDIGWHDLEGGDVNGDGCINILDIVRLMEDYGETIEGPCFVPCAACPPDSSSANTAPSGDINGDCQVNILDLAQAAGNFGLCSNCP
jgi:hypothetical protein